MPEFFNYFPKTVYNFDVAGPISVITNLTTSVSLDETLLNNSVLYYEYVISDGDTPEIVAHKVYGAAENHWIILKMNSIMDVKTEWPLDEKSFVAHLNDKYANVASLVSQTGFEWVNDNVHSYYKVETTTFVDSGEKSVDILQIDSDTYSSLGQTTNTYTLDDGKVILIKVEKSSKTYFEYENELNDAKRNIRILKPDYIPAVKNEFIRVIGNA